MEEKKPDLTPKNVAEKKALMADGKKPEIALVVSDIDNTICDFFSMWGETTNKAFDALCALHNISREELEAAVTDEEHVPAEARMHNLAEMIEKTSLLRPKNEEERKKFDKEHAKIVHEWQKGRDNQKIYQGVIATVRKMKEAGAQFVLYTDGPESAVIPRLAKYGFPPELIDAIYMQPDLDSNGKRVPLKVQGKAAEWKEKFEANGGKLTILEPGSHKPNPETLDKIRKERGIDDPKSMLMVGDNLKADVGGANALGAFSVWQKDGCDVTQEAIDLYYRIPTNPNYLLGLEKMSSQLPNFPPDITLDGGWKDMSKYVRFVSAEKANGTEKSKGKLLPALLNKKANGR